MLRNLLFMLFVVLSSMSIYGQNNDLMRIEKTEDLIIYYPQYSSIDLICGKMPQKIEDDILFCCEAAFTGRLLNTFSHKNIAGNHVSRGKYYNGYSCEDNTGCFVFYQNQWKFLLKNYSNELSLAAQKGGMGFGQNMIIYDKETQPYFRNPESRFEYRALCEYKGKLCVIDSNGIITYARFVSNLQILGVTHALYLDMGKGWNHSWFRNNEEKVIEIHPKGHNYTTNWLVFKR